MMLRAVAALHPDEDVAVIEDARVGSREAHDRRGRDREGREDQDAADAGESRGRYRTLPVIAKCARRLRAQQGSLDSWQSGISLPYDTVFSRSAATPRETRYS